MLYILLHNNQRRRHMEFFGRMSDSLACIKSWYSGPPERSRGKPYSRLGEHVYLDRTASSLYNVV